MAQLNSNLAQLRALASGNVAPLPQSQWAPAGEITVNVTDGRSGPTSVPYPSDPTTVTLNGPTTDLETRAMQWVNSQQPIGSLPIEPLDVTPFTLSPFDFQPIDVQIAAGPTVVTSPSPSTDLGSPFVNPGAGLGVLPRRAIGDRRDVHPSGRCRAIRSDCLEQCRATRRIT